MGAGRVDKTRPVVSGGAGSIRWRVVHPWEPVRRVWLRSRRWFEEFDPWAPRPGDYVLGSLLFLLLAVGYVGEHSRSVELNRRLFGLQERANTLRTEVELLGAEATGLADRHRIVRAAERLGMCTPESGAVEYIYYVSDDADRQGESDETLWP